MRHRYGLAGATEEDELVRARIESLARATHLPCPALLVDLRPRSAKDPRFRQGAQVFGLPGRLTLAVGAGLRTVLRRAPERFDAVITHEFGHIANHDVLTTYLAVTAVGAFLSVSTGLLACWSFVYLWHTHERWTIGLALGYDVYAMIVWDAISIARTLGRYLPFASLVLLELALLFRARETAADRWAATAPAGASWPGLLAMAARSEIPRSRWRRLSALHPSIADRSAALAEPAQGLRVDAADAIIVGAIAALLILEQGELYSMVALAAEAQPVAWEPVLWWVAACSWLAVGGLAWALGKLLRRAVAYRRLTAPLRGWLSHAPTVAVAGIGAGMATLLFPTTVARIDLFWLDGVTGSEEVALVDVLVFAGQFGLTIAATVALAVCFLELSGWPPRRQRRLPGAGNWMPDRSTGPGLGWRDRLRILGLFDALLVLHAYRTTTALSGLWPMPAKAGLLGDEPLVLLVEGVVLLTLAVVLARDAAPPSD